ncbi:MAG: ABC transporter substrate-binding protein, partial [Magnetococcales bacterium]|nr:ABC transporter substrate-binding protein [Magnetococcales bacterium]
MIQPLRQLLMIRDRLSKRELFLLILLLAALFAMLISLMMEYVLLHETSRKEVYVAVVAPLSGPDKEIGEMILRSGQLYVQKVNADGGIHGHPLELVVVDEGTSPIEVTERANLLKKLDVIAIFGHWSAEMAKVGAVTYRQMGIPFISLVSPAGEESLGHHPLLANDLKEIQFLANYVRNILEEKTIAVVHANSDRSRQLVDAFDKTLQRFGTKLVYQWEVDAKKSISDTSLVEIADEVQSKMVIGSLLILADDTLTSARIISALKKKGIRNRLIGTKELATLAFRRNLQEQWQGSSSPQSILNGTVVTTPLSFDTSGETVQSFRSSFIEYHDELPDWVGAITYDALRMVESAILTSHPGPWKQLAPVVQGVEKWLHGLNNPETAFAAMAGPLYFDKSHQVTLPPVMGQYDGFDLISSMTQLLPIRDEGVFNYLKEVMDGRMLYVNDQFMYKTNVVYSGVTVQKIIDVNQNDKTTTLEALIWFRWRGDFEPQDVVFANAIEPILLEKPERQSEEGRLKYRLYRIKGKFLVNYSDAPRHYGSILVGLTFHHRLLGRNNLLYVTDVIGMNITGSSQKTASDKKSATLMDSLVSLAMHNKGVDPLLASLKDNRVTSALSSWILERAWFSQETIRYGSQGDPIFAGFGKPEAAYSRMDMGMVLKN